MRVTSYHTEPNGLRIETSKGTLQLIAYTASIVRVRYAWEPDVQSVDGARVKVEGMEQVVDRREARGICRSAYDENVFSPPGL